MAVDESGGKGFTWNRVGARVSVVGPTLVGAALVWRVGMARGSSKVSYFKLQLLWVEQRSFQFTMTLSWTLSHWSDMFFGISSDG